MRVYGAASGAAAVIIAAAAAMKRAARNILHDRNISHAIRSKSGGRFAAEGSQGNKRNRGRRRMDKVRGARRAVMDSRGRRRQDNQGNRANPANRGASNVAAAVTVIVRRSGRASRRGSGFDAAQRFAEIGEHG